LTNTKNNKYFCFRLGHSELNDMSDNPQDPKYLLICYVCTEKAKEGKYHLRNYGGIVCFSCRAFWRRSHQKTRTPVFICKANSSCVITTVNRRQCQHCRYKRCLDAGMRPDAVLDEMQKRYHFRKLIQRQEKQLAKFGKISGQVSGSLDSRNFLKGNPNVVKRFVILEAYDKTPDHTQTPITYPHRRNDPSDVNGKQSKCTLNDLLEIPTENLFFSSMTPIHGIEEFQTPTTNWTDNDNAFSLSRPITPSFSFQAKICSQNQSET
jgi:hypothetical protein